MQRRLLKQGYHQIREAAQKRRSDTNEGESEGQTGSQVCQSSPSTMSQCSSDTQQHSSAGRTSAQETDAVKESMMQSELLRLQVDQSCADGEPPLFVRLLDQS